jgi:hypothetical protein
LPEQLTAPPEPAPPSAPHQESGADERFARLDEEIRLLRAEVAELRARLISST